MSTYHTMRAMIREANRAYEAEVDRSYHLNQRFDEQGGDGEPPLGRCAELLARLDTLRAAADALPDDRTPEEREADDAAYQDACEDAADRRADRETRRAECGNP